MTDRLGDEGLWLHLNADHHVHAMLQKEEAHFHHIALELARHRRDARRCSTIWPSTGAG